MTAEADRHAVLDRVAEAIWHNPASKPEQSWGRAVLLCSNNADLERRVRATRSAAWAAVEALQIGLNARPEDVRLAMAGEHATGVMGGVCVEAFDAMLAEILA